MFYKLEISKKPLTLRKAKISPNFESKSVLVKDPFEYVNLWLRRNKHTDALFYWQQAKEFYEASLLLPLTAAPLTNYYCFLNATKALLNAKGIDFNNWHGLKGRAKNKQVGLHNEEVTLCMGGVFPELCQYLEQPINAKTEYSLRQILYNLVYIHRSYCLTYPKDSNKELFIPVDNDYFKRDSNERKIYFVAELDKSFANGHTGNKISSIFSSEKLEENRTVQFLEALEYQNSFSIKKLIKNESFIDFHKRIRLNMQYIAGSSKRWYIKRNDVENVIDLGSLPLAMAAMHRLSEMSRYDPLRLSKTLDSSCNWLLSEFIRNSPLQFIDEIASEITGFEFLIPRSAK